jgi:hypothetical protein
MIGKGENKKSMAYIGNMVAFLESCLATDQKYGVYNYVDTPDLTMNELVSQVREDLIGKSGVGLRIPFWLGLIFGFTADVIAKISGKRLPLSSVRIKKFCGSTEFRSAKSKLNGFTPPFHLSEGLQLTLHREFIDPDPNRETFDTE